MPPSSDIASRFASTPKTSPGSTSTTKADLATPFKIGRHVAKAVPQATRPTPEPTGIDYLGNVQAAHEDDTIGTIHYRHAPLVNLPLFNDNYTDETGPAGDTR